MRLSWKIGSLFKIPIRLHYSMVIIPILALSWTQEINPVSVIMAMILAIFLFGSVLVHELGHALTGRRFGVHTVDIILTPIGGMARIAQMTQQPGHEIAISLAGPIVSIILSVIFFVLAILSPLLFLFVPFRLGAELYSLLFSVSMLNLMLGFFNLIPALPMDGGRVLRGLLTIKYRDHLRATQVASKVGRALAIVGAIVGVLYFKSWSLVLISVFIFISAGTELRMAQIREVAKRRPKPGYDSENGWSTDGRKVWSWTWGGQSTEQFYPNRPDQLNEHTDEQSDPVIVEGGKAEVISRRDTKKS